MLPFVRNFAKQPDFEKKLLKKEGMFAWEGEY